MQQDLVLAQDAPLVRQEAAIALPLDAILSAARDPGTDVSKLEALVGLYERMQDRSAKQAYNSAMVACQAEMPRITRDGSVINHKTNQLQSRYATYERIDDIVRPIYGEKYGFAISVSIGMPENGKYPCTAIVRHRDGHSEPFMLPLALDQSGAKNDTQGMGSTQSYARRYLVCGIFNIVTEGDDKDGAATAKTVTKEQANQIRGLLDAAGRNKDAFCELLNVQQIDDIPAEMLDYAMRLVHGAKRK